MQLVKPESQSHWYKHENGIWSACYETAKKNGNGLKKVTLREARELNLYPSVTSILSVINKPGLESWKQEQAILSALTLPRLPDEKLDDFVKRVVKDMEDQSEKARGFGSEIHSAIELYFKGARHLIPHDVYPYVNPFIDWANEQVGEVIGSEVICGCEECGYAGRLDLVCVLKDVGFSVIDAKTQNVKRDKEGIKQPIFYPEWPRQLAAYAHTYGPHSGEYKIPEMVSVIIDSSEPGPVYVKKWDNYLHHMEMFRHCLELWCDERGYKPGSGV